MDVHLDLAIGGSSAEYRVPARVHPGDPKFGHVDGPGGLAVAQGDDLAPLDGEHAL